MINFSQVEEQSTRIATTLLDFMIGAGILLAHIWLGILVMFAATVIVWRIIGFVGDALENVLWRFRRPHVQGFYIDTPAGFYAFQQSMMDASATSTPASVAKTISIARSRELCGAVLEPPTTGLRNRMLPDRELPAEPAAMVAKLRSTRDTLQPIGTAEEQARRREILDDRINKVVLAASLSAGELQDQIVDDLAAEADDLLEVLRDQYGLDDDAPYRYGMG